jgi:hypothetical protein
MVSEMIYYLRMDSYQMATAQSPAHKKNSADTGGIHQGFMFTGLISGDRDTRRGGIRIP